MATKKYSFLLGLITLICSTSVFAQESSVWSDSSYYQSGKLPQYNEFMNNLYAFPPKPRNMWEVGVKLGTPVVGGDVPSNYPGFGFGLHVRKALGYSFSIRGEFSHGTTTGLAWRASNNYSSNPAWMKNGYQPNLVNPSTGARTAAKDQVFYNFKSNVNNLSVEGVLNVSNINFHKAKTKVSLYGFAGLGLGWYGTKVNALNASNAKYNFNSIPTGTYSTRNSTRTALKNLLDDTYETDADVNNGMKLFGQSAKLTSTLGFGVAVRLSKRLNIALEDRIVMFRDDLLDGQQWAEQSFGNPNYTRNYDYYNFLSLGLNINIF